MFGWCVTEEHTDLQWGRYTLFASAILAAATLGASGVMKANDYASGSVVVAGLVLAAGCLVASGSALVVTWGRSTQALQLVVVGVIIGLANLVMALLLRERGEGARALIDLGASATFYIVILSTLWQTMTVRAALGTGLLLGLGMIAAAYIL